MWPKQVLTWNTMNWSWRDIREIFRTFFSHVPSISFNFAIRKQKKIDQVLFGSMKSFQLHIKNQSWHSNPTFKYWKEELPLFLYLLSDHIETNSLTQNTYTIYTSDNVHVSILSSISRTSAPHSPLHRGGGGGREEGDGRSSLCRGLLRLWHQCRGAVNPTQRGTGIKTQEIYSGHWQISGEQALYCTNSDLIMSSLTCNSRIKDTVWFESVMYNQTIFYYWTQFRLYAGSRFSIPSHEDYVRIFWLHSSCLSNWGWVDDGIFSSNV